MFMRRMIGAMAGTVMVGAAGAVGGAGAATAAPDGCPDLYVVAVPGTWETSDANPSEGMLASVTDNLPRNTRTDYVTYAATAFPGRPMFTAGPSGRPSIMPAVWSRPRPSNAPTPRSR